MKKPTAYFAGSITGGRDDAHLYEKIITLMGEHATVLTEHIGAATLSSEGETDKLPHVIHQRDMDWLAAADAVVAEVSVPSMGVGYELRFVEERQKPILLLRREDARRLSGMISGSPYLGPRVEHYNPENWDDLADRLKLFFAQL